MTTHLHLHQENNEDEKMPPCCGGNSNPTHNDNGKEPPLQSQAGNNSLDDLKNEILSNLDKQQRRAPLPLSSVTVSIVLGLLALISIVQGAQSASLYNKLKSGDLKPAASPTSGGSVQNLPSQVGGC